MSGTAGFMVGIGLEPAYPLAVISRCSRTRRRRPGRGVPAKEEHGKHEKSCRNPRSTGDPRRRGDFAGLLRRVGNRRRPMGEPALYSHDAGRRCRNRPTCRLVRLVRPVFRVAASVLSSRGGRGRRCHEFHRRRVPDLQQDFGPDRRRDLLLVYFEPVRLYVAAAGVLVTAVAVVGELRWWKRSPAGADVGAPNSSGSE